MFGNESIKIGSPDRMLNSSLLTFLRSPIRIGSFNRLLFSTNIRSEKVQQKKDLAAKELEFVRDTLRRHGVFKSHLFPPKPYQVTNSRLQKLVQSLKEAVASQDIALLVELSEQIPRNHEQLESVKQALASSGAASFNIALDNYLSVALSDLDRHVDKQKLLSVFRPLFQAEWIIRSHFNDQSSKVIAPIERAMTSHINHLDLPTWCHFVQCRVKLHPKTSPLYSTFLTDIAPQCQNVTDMLAISYLLGKIGGGLNLSTRRNLEASFEQLVKRNLRYWYENEDLAGVLCFGLSKFVKNGRTKNRQLIIFMWDMIMHIMKRETRPELSTTLALCLKQANNSVHAPQLVNYPFVMEKYFSSAEAICAKLCKHSPAAAVNMFRSMVLNQHVSVPVAQKVLQHSTEVNWHDCPLHQFAFALKAISEYGCSETRIYEPMIKYLLSSDCLNSFSKAPDLLLHALEGLAFLQVFPHKLHDLLFTQINSGSSSLMPALYLDGSLSILSPDYKGTRLSDERKQEMKQAMQRKQQHYLNKDGSMTLLKKMSTSALNCIDSIPAISHRFIVQEKSVLDHFPGNDITLKTTDPSVGDVVIVLQDESHFLRLYNTKREPTLLLRGKQRSKLVQLKKLGYQTITMNFQEYQRESNHSQLMKTKLKAAKVL